MRTLTTLLFITSFLQRLAAQDLVSRQQAIKERVIKHHIAPKPIDDGFSAQFYGRFLQTLDPQGLFFTAPDLAKLASYRLAIDDDWNNGATSFFNAISSLYKTRLAAAKAAVTDICSKPFDFAVAETYNAGDTAAALNEKAFVNRWRLLLKAEVLQSLASVALNQWQSKNAIVKTDVLAKEPDARNRVKTRWLAQFAGFSDNAADFSRNFAQLYFNNFLTCFDPHSAFFDAEAQRRFSEALNTEKLAFGFSLGENERGETYIDRIAPGSAAWMSGLLHKGDVPVQLKWEGSAAVDLAGLDEAEISALLAIHTQEKMELTVRKGNGQQQSVVLQKQKLAAEDNTVKSYVLSGKQQIGYVMLPSFYTDWETRGGSRCAADVAREIVKLKKDNITGLILDLRFNGGGSLGEAVELAGIFIDEGVICQAKDKSGKAEALKDMNRGVIFGGPMLVLVNGQSASASEVVAAALQDHHRAVIAGTPTFGKATGQQVFPLQGSIASGDFVKLTDLRLYRATGQTAQQKGVQPDILLPDYFGQEVHEADDRFSLPSDTVAAYKYFRPGTALPLAGLQAKSSARLAADGKFLAARRLAEGAATYRKRKQVSLKWEDMEKDIRSMPAKTSEKIFEEPTSTYLVRNNTADEQSASALQQEYNAFWLKRLAADFYVDEAFKILMDLIQSN